MDTTKLRVDRKSGGRSAARQMLYMISQSGRMRYAGRGEFTGETLYFGKRSRRRAVKIYCKGDEIEKVGRSRKLPDSLGPLKAELLALADDAVRIELVLHAPELKLLALQPGYKWTLETAATMFNSYVERIEFSPNRQLNNGKLMLLPPHLQRTYGLWNAGITPRSFLKPATYYRHRREPRGYGVDIGALKQERLDRVT